MRIYTVSAFKTTCQLIAAFVLPLSAQTGTWTAPTVLSTGGQGWEAAADIDRNGNAVALWDERTTQDQLWSRSKSTTGSWGSVTEVSPKLETTNVFPAVRVSTAGFATAVWSDQNGVWTADRPSPSNWNAPQLLIPGGSNPVFVMNARGDAAVVWTVGGPPGVTSSVMAMLRPNGHAWTPQQTVASGAYVVADHAGIGGNGAVVVAWESFDAVCHRYGCARSAFALHASRQNPGTGMWVDSVALMGPDRAAHDGRPVLDLAGGAILVAVNNSGYASTTQGTSGGDWSPFEPIVNPEASTITAALTSDDAGQVTLVYETISFSSSQAIVVNGSIGANKWSAPVNVSGPDSNVGQILFASSSGGAALAVWLNSSGTPEIRAITRANASANWSSPISVSGPGSEIGPEAAAVNSAGSAVLVYSGYDANDVHTEYAVSH